MPQKNDIGPCTMPVTYLPRHVTSRPACCRCEISAPALRQLRVRPGHSAMAASMSADRAGRFMSTRP